ncbi:MAG TPA: hypothetical protein VNM14_01265 [Planctomycetota bacterium]|jgi:hypothetical protein|nr:hypothetical protein [Planctomycetota bacterium]
MARRLLALGGALVFLVLTAPAEGRQQQGVDQKRIDEAIQRGVVYLRTSESSGWDQHINNCDELVLLTLLHADVPDKDPKVQELLTKVLTAKMERTYKVSLLAMCLEELDRVKYQRKILECAQFLVDNQCQNGQWSYGEPSPFAPGTPSTAPKAAVASAAREFTPGAAKEKPKVVHKLPVEKKREGPPTGDNSNSQYAALGLRACHDAGILLPKQTVIKPAKNWWTTSQLGEKGGKDNAVATAGGQLLADPRGWSYNTADPAYSSMTTGAIGAVCILDYILGDDWKKDKVVAAGMGWLNKNFSVTENIGPCQTGGQAPKEFLYYYLYALERAGMLYDTAFIGNHDWYLDGARVILDQQKPDGSWAESGPATMRPTWDTCFAILFLKRATRPLVVSVDRKK